MRLVAVVGGSIGDDPFGHRTWSGSAYHLFTQLRSRDLLERAFGVHIGKVARYALMAKSVHSNRGAWRRRFYMDPSYCESLTHATLGQLRPADYDHAFLQIGAQFNLPKLLRGKAPCYSYHDGNVIEAMRSSNASRGLSQRRIRKAIAWERSVYHGMTRVLTMSEHLRQSFIRDFGLPENRVVTVGGGINMPTIPAAVPAKSYDTKELLFIGVEFERKGGWLLLKAFARVRSEHPNAVLHIVGPRQLTIPDELAGGVVYHGFIDKSTPQGAAKLASIVEKVCLFVMPSLYEPFGIAPLEAMANGVPCIVTNAWALREMVTPNVNGDLVELNNWEDLAERLKAHIGEPDKLQAWGRAGHARVLEHYTWDQVARRIGEAMQT